MPKMVVYEVYEVTAADPQAAEKKAREGSSHKKSVIVGALNIREFPHPAHLQETIDAFGSIGATNA